MHAKNSLALLKNILTVWEAQNYNCAVMELEELKQRIQRKIDWTEEEIRRLSVLLRDYRKQLRLLRPAEKLASDYDLQSLEEEIDCRVYATMTQEEAVLDVLKRAGEKVLNPRSITATLKDGGYGFRTEDPLNSVYVLLNRLVKSGKVISEKTEDNGVCFRIPMVRTK
jgi:ferritin-like metal-binding protein YciE